MPWINIRVMYEYHLIKCLALAIITLWARPESTSLLWLKVTHLKEKREGWANKLKTKSCSTIRLSWALVTLIQILQLILQMSNQELLIAMSHWEK